MESIDKAIHGMVSKSSGCNKSERVGDLENPRSRGRAHDWGVKDCTAPDDFFDAALGLDLKTGQVKWSKKLQGSDTWTVACITSSGPVPSSPDFDLGGSGPNLVGNVVGFGQKSGIFWALNPDNGSIVWSTQVGPGASLGGIEWGTATDGKRIYVAIANSDLLPYTLVPSGQQITWGAWSALDVATGKILWQTADPTPGTIDRGSVSVANRVMYVGSNSGQMSALNTTTGNILWSFASGGSVIDGPSIVDGTLYWIHNVGELRCVTGLVMPGLEVCDLDSADAKQDSKNFHVADSAWEDM